MPGHAIRRLIAEARAMHQKDAPALQQQLSFWIHAATFQRQLEEALDELVSEEEYLQIDRLELNISVQNEVQFRSSFLRELKKAIRQLQVQQKMKSPVQSSIQQINKNEAVKEKALYFLTHGKMPWSADQTKAEEVHRLIQQKMKSPVQSSVHQINKNEAVKEKALYFLTHGIMPWSADQTKAEEVHRLIQQLSHSDDVIFLANLLEASRSNAAVWRRLIYCIGIKEIKAILLKRLKFSADFMEWVEQLESKNSIISSHETASPELIFQEKENKIFFWQFVLQLVSKSKSESSIRKYITAELDRRFFDISKLKELSIGEGSFNSDNPKVASEPWVKEVFSAPKEKWMEDGCFVANAGLVLIWGELKGLFRRLGYIEDKEFRNKKVQQEAILLLHFLSTGELQVWEDQLLLNKILCGWAVDEPVDTTLVLEEQAQKSSELLLKTFLDEWMKGRKYSPQWLRHNFLRRDGLMKMTPEGSFNLKVERKTEDVLLDILPPGYGHSVVKYTWMQHILFVQW